MLCFIETIYHTDMCEPSNDGSHFTPKVKQLNSLRSLEFTYNTDTITPPRGTQLECLSSLRVTVNDEINVTYYSSRRVREVPSLRLGKNLLRSVHAPQAPTSYATPTDGRTDRRIATQAHTPALGWEMYDYFAQVQSRNITPNL